MAEEAVVETSLHTSPQPLRSPWRDLARCAGLTLAAFAVFFGLVAGVTALFTAEGAPRIASAFAFGLSAFWSAIVWIMRSAIDLLAFVTTAGTHRLSGGLVWFYGVSFAGLCMLCASYKAATTTPAATHSSLKRSASTAVVVGFAAAAIGALLTIGHLIIDGGEPTGFPSPDGPTQKQLDAYRARLTYLYIGSEGTFSYTFERILMWLSHLGMIAMLLVTCAIGDATDTALKTVRRREHDAQRAAEAKKLPTPAESKE
jgi:hypothetical protein